MIPTDKKLDKKLLAEFIDSLTPPNDEMDIVSATIFLQRAGIDPSRLDTDLKERLEREVDEMRARNEDVPEELLRFLQHL
jgi:hypothetical protein